MNLLNLIAYFIISAFVGCVMILSVRWTPELFPYGCAVVAVCMMALNFLIGKSSLTSKFLGLAIILIVVLSVFGDLTARLAIASWLDTSIRMTWHIVIFPAFFLAGLLVMFIQKKGMPEEAN